MHAVTVVMGLLMWPCLIYHNLLSVLRHHVNLLVGHFEEKLRIKRKRLPQRGDLNCLLSRPNQN